MLGAQKVPSAHCTVVFDPRVVSTLLAVVASALSGEAVVKGRSFFAGRIGESIAVGGLTLIDDPTDARAYGATSHDGEGLACRRNLLISDVLGWDDSSRAWFDRFPDIDQVELEASRARTLEDRSIGATPLDVDEKIAAAIRAARVATCLALALALWANWLPVHLEVNAALRRGDFGYRAFVLTPTT